MESKFGPRPFDMKPPMAYDERNKNTTILPRIIKNFPYAERYCPYCEKELDILNAVHLQDHPEIYKALMVCLNSKCGAYDEEAKQAYVRAYYSSEQALQLFETTLLRIQKLEKS